MAGATLIKGARRWFVAVAVAAAAAVAVVMLVASTLDVVVMVAVASGGAEALGVGARGRFWQSQRRRPAPDLVQLAGASWPPRAMR